MRLKFAFAAMLALAACAVLAYSLSSDIAIRNVGSVQTVGSINAYWDVQCSRQVSEIDWGVLTLGENKTVTIYIRNEGASTVKLSYGTEKWQPAEASQFMELTWDYNGQWLAPNAVLPISFCLHVSPDIQGVENFSFNIIISTVA